MTAAPKTQHSGWAGAHIAVMENDWDRQKPEEVESMIKRYNDGEEHISNHFHTICSSFTESDMYKNNEKDKTSYKICCETLDYCSFYKQTWFYLACAGVGLLIIIALIVVICCCCRKGRGGGGKDLEVAEESSDSIQKED